jgi:hypothetical protein
MELNAFQVQIGRQLAGVMLYVAQAVHQAVIDTAKIGFIIVIVGAQDVERQDAKYLIHVGTRLRRVLERLGSPAGMVGWGKEPWVNVYAKGLELEAFLLVAQEIVHPKEGVVGLAPKGHAGECLGPNLWRAALDGDDQHVEGAVVLLLEFVYQ